MRWGALALLLIGACDSGECDRLAAELIAMVRTDCPPDPKDPSNLLDCGGNPDMNAPQVPFSKRHYDLQRQIAAKGCALPDLGEAPFYCNNGSPACPDGYHCLSPPSPPRCVR